jgi:hypothetical protein
MYKIQVIILLILSGCMKAQEVQFTASISPNVLRMGEQFNLTYTSNQELEALDLPEIHDFELLGGPSQGHSQSVYSVNGKITTTSTWQYTYLLKAVKDGKFTIAPASVKVKNKTYRSNTVDIEVLKASEQSASQNPVNTNENATQSGSYSDKDLFVKLILDKKEAYIGEQITATVKIYTKTNLSGIDQGFKGPDFTGFFTEPFETPPLQNLQREAVDGDIYFTGLIRKLVIIPQKTGEIIIQPFDLDVAIRHEVRRKIADPFFEDFVIPDVQEIPAKLKSKSVKVRILPLPSNAPASFKGAVGNFKVSSSVNKTITATNDPLTLKLTISGKGNIKLINEVEVKVPYDMERYDPVIKTNLDSPLSGSKTFEYLIMPRAAGKFTIPAVEFTYFDPEAKQYRSLKTQSYLIHVEQGQGDTIMSLVPGMTKEDVKMLNQDVRFIKTKPFRVHAINYFIARSPWYFLLYALSLIIFIAMLLIRTRLVRQNADIAGMRIRKADKYARKRLRKSEGLLKLGNDTAFFEELLGAIWGYLSDKLNIPVSLLSKDSAMTALQDRAVDQEMIDRLFQVTDKCEMARYARGTGDIVMDKLYREALEIISTLQQKLKRA